MMQDLLQTHQKTLKSCVEFNGIGLHSGTPVNMKVLPATSNHGIVFQRTDNSMPSVKATIDQVSQTELCTVIGKGSNSIATIEHLMAAFSAFDIENALVEINGPEVPILDGSSKPYIDAFKKAGVHYLDKLKSILVLKKEITIEKNGKYIKAKPYFGQKFLCSIDFDYKSIGQQKIAYFHSQVAFEKISKARTFCHLNDVEKLKANGLALGGSLDNAIVVSNESVLNSNGLRCHNEFVKHKLLDMIGDLWLLNKPLFCEIESSKSGHSLHCEFAKAIMDNFDEYLEEITLSSDAESVLPLYANGENSSHLSQAYLQR